jgi:hypothetical protein
MMATPDTNSRTAELICLNFTVNPECIGGSGRMIGNREVRNLSHHGRSKQPQILRRYAPQDDNAMGGVQALLI